MSRRIPAGALVLSALVLGLGACSDSTVDPSETNTMSDALVQDVGQDATEDLAEMMDASVYDASTGVYLMTAPANALSVPPACVTVTPDPLVNSDTDVVPDSARFDYNACGFSRAGGFLLDSLSGIIDFLDPQPTVNSHGVRHVYHDFTRARINVAFPLRSFRAVHNGTREWGGNADTLGHTVTNFVSTWTHPGGRVTTLEKDWVARFTATTPGSITSGDPLPAGAWTASGTSSWSTANRSWSLALSTTEPLVYDPSCTVTPRLTDGTLNLVATRNGVITNIQIAFINCGEYQVTRTAGTI